MYIPTDCGQTIHVHIRGRDMGTTREANFYYMYI